MLLRKEHSVGPKNALRLNETFFVHLDTEKNRTSTIY